MTANPSSSFVALLRGINVGGHKKIRMQDLRDLCESIGRHIYLHCPDGFARTKLTNNFFENKLRLTATTRNWKTVNTLSDMLKQR
jgi:uncharacterized protein (DUF1697 family)